MKYVILAATLLVPALASAQVTTYIPRSNGGGILYQYGSRPSITNTIPNGNGGFTQYHYGPGRAPAFVQPLPTPNYNYGGYGYNPGYGGYNYGGYRPYVPPVYRPRPYWGGGAW